jgi:hypothetical protein
MGFGMRLYSKKLIRNKVSSQIYASKEGRDAIVRLVDPSARYAIIRIQGTDEDIYSGWSENWHQAPPWLRVGNSVMVRHPKGNPNKWEIFANGVTIPTPVGGGSILPVPEAGEASIISGGQVLVYDGMTVHITAGTYRIADTYYAFPGLYMGNTTFDYMGDHPSILMGSAGTYVTLAAAPSSPNYRIDALFIGTDRVIDYVQGTPHATDPVAPTTPSNHVLISYIIVPYGTTQLEQSFIGNAWTAPYLASFVLSMELDTMLWSDPVTQDGTIELFNQYLKPHLGTYKVRLIIESGNGSLSASTPDVTSQDLTLTTGVGNFTYTRGGGDYLSPTPDVSPMLKAYVIAQPGTYYGYAYIRLLDSLGEMMY